ncbi:MAG TPA: HEAT repeat domain-containing protein [Tepidisphaeraceae bacterium]|nr:HEAT repeat domain-containing protein [Tepidisphaeraceae bacterium]
MSSRWNLLLLAALWTLLNCIKPVHIDDASYLKFAREFANHPLDPYAFQLSWDQWPEPAIWFTAPAVLSYWLAPAARWFYDHPFVVKLWMFPFAWLFVWGLYQLCRRFVGAHELLLCWMTVLSGAFLPAINLMLDIPSLALFFASLELTCRAIDRKSNWLAVAGGLLAAMAMETKYTTLLAPAVLFTVGITMQRWKSGALAAGTACLAMAAWESFLAMKYGQSQFIAQLVIDDPRRRLTALETFTSLPPYLAAPAPFLIVLGILKVAKKVPGTFLAADSFLAAASVLVALCVLLTTTLLFNVITALLIVIAAIAIWQLWLGSTPGSNERRVIVFLLAWLAIELAGAIVISPFPAVRRFFGVVVVLTLLLARAAFTMRPIVRLNGFAWRIACAACVVVALTFYVSDVEEAFARQHSIEEAAATVRRHDPRAKIWYIGHWGVEYYAEREGMQPLVPDQSVLRAGDWLVVGDGVHSQGVLLVPQMLEVVDRPITKFHLRWSTARSYYGGIVPLTWHRPISDQTPIAGLQPTILRVTRDGVLPSDFPLSYLLEGAKHRGSMVPDGMIRSLINFAVNGSATDAESAERALIAIGPRAMMICLRNQSPGIRLLAAEQLGRMGDRLNDDAVDALRRATQDPDPAVRDAAVESLSRLAL